jgi:CRISPR-associated protein Cst1
MSNETAGLRWTGHALLDVGVAGLCALSGRDSPERLTLVDLDKAGDFIAEHYFSGVLDPYLIVIFLNGGYCGPNKVDDPKEYEEVYRAHRVLPQKHVDPNKHLSPATGQRCVFSGLPATAWVHRQHLPLFSADNVMNFRPEGQTSVPIAGVCLVALQFLPMVARRAEGRLLAVHADDPRLTLAFAQRYLEDNKRLLALALPANRGLVHAGFDRELPMWDTKKKRYKMADAKGPRSLVLADLTDIASKAAPSDIRPHPVGMTVYLLSNSGQEPSLEIITVPSGVVSFIRRAAQAKTVSAWNAITQRFQPLQEKDEEGKPKRKRKAISAAPVAGRAGWTRNPAFEDLCEIYEVGFIDRRLAAVWLRRYVLGRIETTKGEVRYEETHARLWALAELFLQEVLGMKKARIEAIRQFADKLASWIQEKNDRSLYRSLTFDRPWELRQTLLRAQRDGLPFGLDEYAAVWLHEDESRTDEALIRDLVCIRVVERLRDGKYFDKHPEEELATESATGDQTNQEVTS